MEIQEHLCLLHVYLLKKMFTAHVTLTFSIFLAMSSSGQAEIDGIF